MNHLPQGPLRGGIEAGGTKFLCTVSHGYEHGFLARTRFDTGSAPAALLKQVADWFVEAQQQFGKIEAIGVASFGPVEPDPRSDRFGFITTTPKHGWQNTDLLGPLQAALPGIRLGFDTDVNGAALGECGGELARGWTTSSISPSVRASAVGASAAADFCMG